MQVSDQIIEVLEYLCKKIGVTIDFTNKNILPYVNQLCEKYINWEITTSIMWILIAIIAGIVAYFICIWLYKMGKKEEENQYYSDSEAYYGLMAVIIIFSSIYIILTIIFQTLDIIECLTFPEKAIYDYVTTLMEAK